MRGIVFFFKTPYFIIIHLAFITVTHYKMYVHLIRFQRLCISTARSLSLSLVYESTHGAERASPPLVSHILGGNIQERRVMMNCVTAELRGTLPLRSFRGECAICCLFLGTGKCFLTPSSTASWSCAVLFRAWRYWLAALPLRLREFTCEMGTKLSHLLTGCVLTVGYGMRGREPRGVLLRGQQVYIPVSPTPLRFPHKGTFA